MNTLLLLVILTFSQTPQPKAQPIRQPQSNSASVQKAEPSANKSGNSGTQSESKRTQPPTRSDEQRNNSQEAVKVRELPPVSITKDWSDRAYWVFSLLLVVVGGLQVWLLHGTLKATAASAAAAKANAEAVVNSERAWLLPNEFLDDLTLPAARDLAVKIRNFGRTPAFVTEWVCGALISETEDVLARLNFSSPNLSSSGIPFTPGRQENFWVNWEPGDLEQVGEVLASRKHLYIYGVVRYRDIVSGDTRESNFCFHYFRRGRERGWAMEPPEANRCT